MKRRHHMSFGADVGEGYGTSGEVGFALWAPRARSVALRLLTPRGERDLPMQPQDGGWYRLSTVANADDRYFYVIDCDKAVPDPASRWQPQDVHGPSAIVDPAGFDWTDGDWRGRPWEETVLYELHVGTFTPQGSYAAARDKLADLAALGVTAIELMPLAEAPGAHNWGYDGVGLFAPEACYGSPEDLKRFICEAHSLGLMVFLDVVYNHFGPEGNYLGLYAPQFFTERHHTPWGAAINFDDASARTVRDFYVHNALYWLTEFNFDGLRFDAVHSICDDSAPDILFEIGDAAGRIAGDRYIHLVLENDDNAARYLERDASGRPRYYAAQWNDDWHHAMHVLLTGETDGYYADYADDPGGRFARSLAQGFIYQGEPSPHRGGKNRGEPSAHLPPSAFVTFLQNHDQIGNRPRGERIAALAPAEAVQAATAILLLVPSPPLLFMGEEWASTQPFCFFCDFEPRLAQAVREGRRREFAHFFDSHGGSADTLPDPTTAKTFRSCVLQWDDTTREPHRTALVLSRKMLAIRHREIVPRLAGSKALHAAVHGEARRAITAEWQLGDDSILRLTANLTAIETAVAIPPPRGEPIFATEPAVAAALPGASLPPWFVAWHLSPAART